MKIYVLLVMMMVCGARPATAPLATDCAPYYHWKAFKRYCLKKIDSYEKRRKRIK